MISARTRNIKNSLHVRKWHSVPERASCGTEYARGAKNKLLWYATRFQGHLVRRTGFSGTGVIFGTGNPLLRYGADIRCAKQAPVVRDAFSGALGVKNRLFWYRSDIWYRKPPSLVPNRYSCAQNSLLWYAAHFQGPRARGSPLCTEYARGAKNRLLWYATRFQGHPVRR